MEATLEKMYRAKVRYFERPVVANAPYPYKLVNVTNPLDFLVSIEDDVTKSHEDELQKALEEYTAKFEKEKWIIEANLIYEMMPVVVNVAVSGGDPWSFARGEVVKFDENENLVDVLRVDTGGVLKVTPDKLYGIPLDLLRIPKLAIPCALAFLRPANSSTWAEKDYALDFTGKSSQIITFVEFYPDLMSYEVILQVDKVNVAMRFLHLAIADPVELQNLPSEGPVQSYPLRDFSSWVGMKQIVFGVKVVVDNVDGSELIKCILQMEPENVNCCQSKIAEFIQNLSEEDVKKLSTSLNKVNGAPCLAPWGDEYFRSTILARTRTNEYLVRYVDYGEDQTVDGSKLLPLPLDLLEIPEGGTVCIMTEFLGSDFKDVDKLKELIENQDLYAVVEGCDPEQFGRELLVSLYEPVDHTGPDRSFLEILGTTRKVPCVSEVLRPLEMVSQPWAELFLIPELPFKKNVYTGVTLINNHGQLFLQLEESRDKIARISKELDNYYKYGGWSSDDDFYTAFLAGSMKGKLVVAASTGSEALLRGIVEDKEGERLRINFIDFGHSESVSLEDVFPLHAYFVKDKLCAVEIKLVV